MKKMDLFRPRQDIMCATPASRQYTASTHAPDVLKILHGEQEIPRRLSTAPKPPRSQQPGVDKPRKTETENAEYGSCVGAGDILPNNVVNPGAVFGEYRGLGYARMLGQ